jgi:hypothetical protein
MRATGERRPCNKITPERPPPKISGGLATAYVPYTTSPHRAPPFTYVWLGFWVLSMGQPGAPVLNAVFTRVWALKKKIGPFVGNARVFASNY